MTPAEIAAHLAAQGWTQEGAQITSGARKLRIYTHPHARHQPLLVIEHGGTVRLFREMLHSDPRAVIAGKARPF